MHIRPVELADHEAIWSIFQEVIQAGDSFVFEPDTPKEDFYKHWLASYMHTYVCEMDGLVAGAYFMKPNQPGLGNHICNAGYMVHPQFRGKRLAQEMCAHSLVEAKRLGYLGMQYNIVVSTNTSAVHVWKKMGFSIIGVTPNAFRHLELGLVDAFIMYREL